MNRRSNRALKKQTHSQSNQELVVIQGGSKKEEYSTFSIVSFLLTSTLVFSSAFFFIRWQMVSESLSLTPLSSLYSAIESQNKASFYEMKSKLRDEVSSILSRNSSDPQYDSAESIAIYMFPELLPESSYEKELAMELFSPLLKELESSKNQSSLEQVYATLESRIYGFESATRQMDGVSETAHYVLKIYKALPKI